MNNKWTTSEHKQECKKERKKENIDSTDAESVWKEYPKKSGKAKAIGYINKHLKKYSKEELIQAINNYKSFIELERKKYDRQYQDGSTFFNKAIIDYIGQNYNVVELPQKKEKIYGF